MKRMRAILVAALTWLVMGMMLAPAFAQQDAGDVYRRKQQAQEKARALAGELVNAVLDIQLRQLAENGLAQRSIYKDIASMKGSIGELMKDDMEVIVKLLVQAQEGSQQERLAKFNEARGRIREVVVQLMAERQKLFRRMQIAKLSAQVRELINMQTKTQTLTVSLPSQTPTQRDTLALGAIEDQADVQRLFYQLVFSLEDVKTWGGQVAAGAEGGLRILRAAQVDQELKSAGQQLAKAEFTGAGKAQEAVIRGLRSLLEKLEETQGLIDSDREAALKMVREMMKKQEQLRDATKKSPLDEKEADKLSEKQTELHKELGKLAQALQSAFPTTEPLLDDAKAAALEARRELFEADKAEALEKQNQVI